MIKRPSLHEYLYNILHKKCGVKSVSGLAGAEGWLLLVTGSASDIIYHPPVPPAVSCDVTTGHKSQNVTNVVTLTHNWSH